MTNWIVPPELNAPLPRQYKTKSSAGFLYLPVAFTFLLVAYLIFSVIIPIHNIQVLKRLGVPADGDVIGLHTQYVRGKYAHTDYYVDYQYSDENSPHHGSAQVFFDDYQNIKTGQKIRVIYSKENPSQSTLPFSRIYGMSKSDPPDFPGLLVYISVGTLLIFGFGSFIFTLRIFYKEKFLYTNGTATHAVVIEKNINKTKNGITFVKLRYSFKDSVGQNIEAKGSIRECDFNTETMTVLYDPNNSQRNALYPLQFVESASPLTL